MSTRKAFGNIIALDDPPKIMIELQDGTSQQVMSGDMIPSNIADHTRIWFPAHEILPMSELVFTETSIGLWKNKYRKMATKKCDIEKILNRFNKYATTRIMKTYHMDDEKSQNIKNKFFEDVLTLAVYKQLYTNGPLIKSYTVLLTEPREDITTLPFLTLVTDLLIDEEGFKKKLNLLTEISKSDRVAEGLSQ